MLSNVPNRKHRHVSLYHMWYNENVVPSDQVLEVIPRDRTKRVIHSINIHKHSYIPSYNVYLTNRR